jgi:M6 family metalloprotease-like protein
VEVLTRLGRSSLPLATTTAVEGIVLLVDFSDETATIATAEIRDYCNQVGYTGYGNNGSVRDYFYDVSDGNLTYTNFVPTSYYRASEPKSYYDESSVPCCSRAREMMYEALADLDAQGFDFSEYDSNNDGVIDAVNCFYAGTRNGPWSYGLWPHSGWMSFSADGVTTERYQITDLGDQLRLSTFCHENGHMVMRWPDLYDYDHDSRGIGRFGLMCSSGSGTNPVEPCAYMKYIAGWSTTTVLTVPQAGLTVPSGINTFYKFEHPLNANEYYLVENRQQVGRDSVIPDAGLAIWHIDETGDNDYQQMTPLLHYEVTLVQADGNWDLEYDVNSGDDTDLWSSPGYTECAPTTIPNTGWWDGSASGLIVTNVSASASTMTFDFKIDCNNNGTIDEAEIPTACGGSCSESCDPDCNCDGVPDACQLVLNDCNQNSIPDDCDIALGPDTDCNSNGLPDWCDVTGAGVKLDEDFEGGLPGGWSVTGGFQITSLCGDSDPDCGGSGWGYAGETSTCSYGDYEFRELIAPPVTLGYGLSELRFCSRIETEADWDFGRVRVNGESVWEDSGLTGVWEEQVVDLRAFAGQTVTITFEFSTDTNTSGWLGWQVDNVLVTSGVPDDNEDGIPDECGACCGEQDCEQLTQALCEASEGGEYRGDGTTCEAECPAPIPTVSEWGLVVLSLALLTAGSVVIARRKRPVLN